MGLEPQAGRNVGLIGPPMPRPDLVEPDELKDLLDRIRVMIEDAIQNAIQNASSDIYADLLNEMFFEINNSINEIDINRIIAIIIGRIGQSLRSKIFEVQSEATGDGVYNCYEQSLDATEWADTAGDDKFDDKNTTSIEVLNLIENNPNATYAAGLIAGDRMTCWQGVDDEGNKRWVGVPLLSSTRSAKIQAGGVPANATGPFTCKLLGAAGTEVGSTIAVYPREHLGTNAFNSGDVHPSYAAADYMPVFLAMDGKWYTQCVFEDTIDCVCTEP